MGGALPAYESGTITTTLTGGETVDTTALKTEAILAGSNSRSLWEPSDTTPGKTSSVTLRFYMHGEIPVGGNIGVRLPPNDGWGFSAMPSATFVAPSGTTGAASWDGKNGVNITVATAA